MERRINIFVGEYSGWQKVSAEQQFTNQHHAKHSGSDFSDAAKHERNHEKSKSQCSYSAGDANTTAATPNKFSDAIVVAKSV